METRIQQNKVKEIGTLHASDIFGKIYLKNGWCGCESISGPGSDVARCESIIKEDVVGEFADKSLGLWNVEELKK